MQSNSTALPSFQPLMDTMIGPVRMAVLDTFITLELADAIEKTGNSNELANILNLNKSNLAYLLDAATTIGLTDKRKGRYKLTDLSRHYLLRSSETYLGEMVQALSAMQHRNLDRMEELVRQGKPPVPKEQRLQDPEHWKRSARHLACYHRSGVADMMADIVDRIPGHQSMGRMLDLGAGPGVIGLGILKRHPQMSGVLFDLPAVAEVARQEVVAAEMEDRVEVIGGDYNEISFGREYDLVLSSLNLYYARDLTAFIGRIRDALNPGGVYISFHEGLTCERTHPSRTVLSRLSLALEGQDLSFSQGTIPDAMLRAGFARVHSRTIQTPMGTFELDIALRDAPDTNHDKTENGEHA